MKIFTCQMADRGSAQARNQFELSGGVIPRSFCSFPRMIESTSSAGAPSIPRLFADAMRLPEISPVRRSAFVPEIWRFCYPTSTAQSAISQNVNFVTAYPPFMSGACSFFVLFTCLPR
jgi:hypothetical protein